MTANNNYAAATELASYTSAAIATMGACPVWDAAMSTYLAKLTLAEADMRYGAYATVEEEVYSARHSLATQHGKPFYELPKEIITPNEAAEKKAYEAWTANFVQPQWDAATALVCTPAPTLAAAVFKHKLIEREETPQWADLPFDCMDLLAADFARLTNNSANAAWQAARDAEQAAQDAAQRFYDENVRPANEAHEEGKATFDDVRVQEEAYAAYSDNHLAAIKAMMATPAPSVSAALHKLRVGLRDWLFEGSEQGCSALEHIASDLARLTGEA